MSGCPIRGGEVGKAQSAKSCGNVCKVTCSPRNMEWFEQKKMLSRSMGGIDLVSSIIPEGVAYVGRRRERDD
ncbi:hypothetical protein SASPL_150494 [Salvia splendens]|uniref:Uncharacterized protein n=1 Tax=Salvia splendens TaxID=180675 RepID=A0A8X8W6N7_SALSN|nr:hypothetical protein SASPL_150494 [Salvia splendens]